MAAQMRNQRNYWKQSLPKAIEFKPDQEWENTALIIYAKQTDAAEGSR